MLCILVLQLKARFRAKSPDSVRTQHEVRMSGAEQHFANEFICGRRFEQFWIRHCHQAKAF